MVKDRVWKAAGMPASDPEDSPGQSGSLCIGCLEARLGRRLQPSDFTAAPINDPDDPWHTPRLLSRLLGERELRRLAKKLGIAWAITK